MHFRIQYIGSLIIIFWGLTFSQNRPFPQALDYDHCIKPDIVTQEDLNTTVKNFYDYWKDAYLRPSNGQTPGGWYIYSHPDDPDKKTVSEAHGYGMIIMALMAGYDDSAKIYFDGMYAMYNDHRSTIDHDLMSWLISPDEDPADDEDNATDGDMDIAYALLLANDQWGSDGAIGYLAEAKRIITNGTKESNTNHTRLMLGDWWFYDSKWEWASRSSDWMTDHLQAYYQVTGDTFWLNLADSIFGIVNHIRQNYSPATGLMPDFIDQGEPQPAPPNFLESEYDGQYNWNACRFPWRMATDFAHYGSGKAKAAIDRILSWLKPATGDNPANIKPGYFLNGDPLPGRDYTSNAFTAPFIAACIVDSAHQQYLNDGWSLIKDVHDDYYADTINLLCMLLISGNWWHPEQTTSLVHLDDHSDMALKNLHLAQNYPNPFNPVTIIHYRVSSAEKVCLTVFNSLGQKVATLVNQKQAPGEYEIKFDASRLSGGVYFYRLTQGKVNSEIRKMIVLR